MGRKAIATVLFSGGLMTVTMGAMFFQQAGSGMAGYWKCDDVAAPTTDSSGTTNNGTWSGTVTSLTGAANTPAATAFSTGCLNFNSTTAQVAVPGTAALTITGDFTVAFWMYPNADAGDWQRLVGKGNSTDRTFGVWRTPNAEHKILFQQYSAGGAVINITTGATTPNTAWTHVACRIQGNAAAVFINGVSNVTGTRTGTPSAVQSDPVTFAYAGFHTSFPGRLDDVRMYNRALSNADILALSAGGQGPAAPTGLTAAGAGTQVDLSWTGAATVYNVKRASVSGGAYTTIASNVGGTTYSDTTAAAGQTYYYVVSGVTYGEGPNSNEASATTGPVTATPNTGLFTNENGATTTFDIKFHLPSPGSTVTVVSDNIAEGTVSIPSLVTTPVLNAGGQQIGVSFPVAVGQTPTIAVLVTGVDDVLVDGPVPYTVTVTASGVAIPIPPVRLTNNDNDIQGLTFSRTSGLVTSESGGQAQFTVQLNRRPFGNVSFSLLSSHPLEGTVLPGTLTFTPTGVSTYSAATGFGDWNIAHEVTLTGVDDSDLDFTIPYSIVTGALAFADTRDNTAFSNAGVTSAPDVGAINLDNEVPPELPAVWGGSGCGLVGLELALPLLLGAALRRGTAQRRPASQNSRG